jgi:DNA-binding GntR family transcriptional regulator
VVSGLAGPRPLTLREHAIQTLRQAIVSGALPPGERIREEELAQQLGISRGPVREAIRALEQEGLVRTEPYRASYVTSLSEEELEHLYRVRAEVAVIAARRLAGAMAAEPARLAPYATLLEEMRGAAAQGALARLSGADLRFHQQLLEDSGYAILPRVWATMDHIVRARTAAILAAAPDEAVVVYTAESHAPIVEALKGGDPEQAAQAVRRHILETRDILHRRRPLSSVD